MNVKTNIQVKRTPFFGRYISETVENRWSKESVEERKKRKARLKSIFEIVDDYVEQA